MRLLSIFCSLLLFCTPVFSADPVLPVLIISENGYSWMIQDADGKPVVYGFSQVIVLNKPIFVPPTSTSTFGLEATIRPLIANLSVSGRLDLPAFIKGISEAAALAKDGKLKTTGEVEAVTSVLMKAAIKDKDAWSPIAIAIDEALVKLQKSGRISSPASYGQALTEIVKGMQ